MRDSVPGSLPGGSLDGAPESDGVDMDDSLLAEQQLVTEDEGYRMSFEDTFRGKMGEVEGRRRGRSVLDESGLDEMF